ncbi:hypothetical protein [Rothia sp. ZJ1223]|uniref:hypothetical protein n=1 Tax=Rothia sp. ZJ1223 TaxID=2811098 RepID=UPI001959415C|nr:hypothetical protein [Rothia sp. ZJ1223]MBM7050881.1 hypothetical protein [Rothia sp. ZJ1223]
MKKQLSVLATSLLLLVGCSSRSENSPAVESAAPHATSSSSASETARATASSSAVASDTSSQKPTVSEVTHGESETMIPLPQQTALGGIDDNHTLPTTAPLSETGQSTEGESIAVPLASELHAPSIFQQYRDGGGTCTADVWDSSMEYTEEAWVAVISECDAQDLGAWANGYDPFDPANYDSGAASGGADAKFSPAEESNVRTGQNTSNGYEAGEEGNPSDAEIIGG